MALSQGKRFRKFPPLKFSSLTGIQLNNYIGAFWTLSNVSVLIPVILRCLSIFYRDPPRVLTALLRLLFCVAVVVLFQYQSSGMKSLSKTYQDYEKSRAEEKLLLSQEPGPGAYEIVSRITDAPSFSLRGRPQIPIFVNPAGPGSFSPQLQKRNDFKFSMASRHDSGGMLRKTNDTPGPFLYSEYQPPGPKISFSSKQIDFNDVGLNTRPGPNEYSVKTQFTSTSPVRGVRIGLKLEESPKNAFVPGPGAYSPAKPVERKVGPRISDSMRPTSQLTARGDNGPGPATYHKEKSPDFSKAPTFGYKLNLYVENKNPGPGSYNYSTMIGENRPGISLKSRYEPPTSRGTPGPIYDIQRVSSPARDIRIGRRTQSSCAIERTPGPLDYCPQRPLSEASVRHISLAKGTAIEELKPSTEPAPCSYDAEKIMKAYRKDSKRELKIGVRTDQVQRASLPAPPGPGAYESPQRKTKAISIGEKSPQRITNSVPGPGAYQISRDIYKEDRYAVFNKRSSAKKLW